MLGLVEMSTMYDQLDLYKQSGSVMDRKTLITLNVEWWQFVVKKLSKLHSFDE